MYSYKSHSYNVLVYGQVLFSMAISNIIIEYFLYNTYTFNCITASMVRGWRTSLLCKKPQYFVNCLIMYNKSRTTKDELGLYLYLIDLVIKKHGIFILDNYDKQLLIFISLSDGLTFMFTYIHFL